MIRSSKGLLAAWYLLALSTLLIAGCKTSKTELATAQKIDNALLWEISGKGLETPSYLYGTIHLIDQKDFFFPPKTLSSFEGSEKVFFEIDMNEMNDMGKLMGLLPKTFMKDDKRLADLLSKEDYAVVEDHFQDMGLPLFMLERIKPMFLSIFAMGGDLSLESLQDGSMKSYEMEFADLANQSKKPVSGLETIEFQLSVFDTIPYTDQAEMLVDMIKNGDSSSGQFQEMIQMYKDQRINDMVSSIENDPNGMGDHEDILLKLRNENWIPIMKKEMAQQPTFFAVGAAHLAGPHGVIPLLRKAGYTLKPLSI